MNFLPWKLSEIFRSPAGEKAILWKFLHSNSPSNFPLVALNIPKYAQLSLMCFFHWLNRGIHKSYIFHLNTLYFCWNQVSQMREPPRSRFRDIWTNHCWDPDRVCPSLLNVCRSSFRCFSALLIQWTQNCQNSGFISLTNIWPTF